MDDENKARLEAMEGEKERKIRQYMELQDQADAMNEQIYKVCCDVEALNVKINALKAELKKTAQKGAKAILKPAPNGKGNGAGHSAEVPQN